MQASFFGVGSFRFTVTAWRGDNTLENVTASVVVDVMCVSVESDLLADAYPDVACAFLAFVSSYSVIPAVSVDALSSAVSPSGRLVLAGTVGPAPYDYDMQWSLTAGALATGSSLESASRTRVFNEVGANEVRQTYLVLGPGALTAGGTYEFELSAG